MNLLVIGGGGREHAIIQKLRENREVETIWALPGNGGIAAQAECVNIAATDIEGILAFARAHDVDFAVVAPDDPLALGAVDRLQELGIPCFGPSARAAQIESSKVFAKSLMQRYGIPTAAYAVYDNAEDALAQCECSKYPLVIKADGLALGKGVSICENKAQARDAIRAIMQERVFGESGSRVVIEAFLRGPEVSVLAFTDGETIVPMVSSMDHKRAGDGDTGPNTGGMGAIAPNPFYTPEIAARCMREIFLPTMHAMNAEGRPFRGCLYFGLMLTEDGPKVIEYNCRFGDPETQVVLPLLQSDLLTVMQAVATGTLYRTPITYSDRHACCVVLASGGYPGAYAKGLPVALGDAPSLPHVRVYHAGTACVDGKLVTAGGRLLGVTAMGDTLAQAIERAYDAAAQIEIPGAFCRSDIGQRALQEGE